MSRTINAVPESITRNDYLSLIRSVGFDPNELVALEFGTDGIRARAFSRNDDGSTRLDGGEPVIDTIYIPVVGIETESR